MLKVDRSSFPCVFVSFIRIEVNNWCVDILALKTVHDDNDR